MPQFVDSTWSKVIAWVRVTLGVVSLATVFLTVNPPAVQLAAGLFLVYSLLLLLRGVSPRGMFWLVPLLADCGCFMILANFGAVRIIGLIPTFLLYLFAEALVFHGAVEVAAIAVGVSLFCAVSPNHMLRAVEPAAMVGGALAWAFALERRRQTAETESVRRDAETARTEADKAGEQERLRIASDFHDGPLQSFISMQMRLEIIRKLLARDAAQGMEDLEQLQILARTQVRDLRAFLNSMRPVAVDGAGLVAAARRAAEAFQKESGIPVVFQGSNKPVGLPQETALEVLQMLREALRNAQKHAGATRVAVAVEKGAGSLEVSVDDNGHGFDFSGAYSLEELELLRLGPESLKRRARSLNADMILESHPGRGAGLKIRVPLP